jgi:hypothetical protein
MDILVRHSYVCGGGATPLGVPWILNDGAGCGWCTTTNSSVGKPFSTSASQFEKLPFYYRRAE